MVDDVNIIVKQFVFWYERVWCQIGLVYSREEDQKPKAPREFPRNSRDDRKRRVGGERRRRANHGGAVSRGFSEGSRPCRLMSWLAVQEFLARDWRRLGGGCRFLHRSTCLLRVIALLQ